MTTRILSKRAKTILARFASLEVERVTKMVNALDQEGLNNFQEEDNTSSICYKEWQFEIELVLPQHHDECECDDVAIPLGERCDCEYDYEKWAMRLYHRDTGCSNKNHMAGTVISARHSLGEKAIESWINWLKEEWKTCVCGKEVVRGDHCRDCFIHAYERTEEEGGDCCVCHENNGRWAKLECGHVLHTHCWEKVVGHKCPLCRNPSGKTTRDPYDV